MPGIGKTLKDVRAVYGAIPTACGVLNNLVFPVIPITPLLRGLAVLILLVSCTLAVLWALSFSNDVPKDPVGNTRLRKYSLVISVFGVALLIGYFAFATYFNQHDVQNLVLNGVVDAVQATLFASPWTLWSASLVLMVPRK
jgi:hypothetical protein